ncbi:uncharacterized protein LOC112340942 [Selaginella moellendorffii]|uniref:uncharacterized protein LOC112340942 n=1 Tax=Selaginella moellendorffii TaxID=88036 RepID=UPI000D1C8E3D|nr:uncharacterized protein LOC112340942 [Selaginella moellendorffii]|eukprot:XP_024515982.1 uncharacterized protein LOC112340942 [Selaginella moellendorffii]
MASSAAVAGNLAAAFGSSSSSSQVVLRNDDRCAIAFFARPGRLRGLDSLRVATRTRATTGCNAGNLVFDAVESASCSTPIDRSSFWLQPLSLSQPCSDMRTLDKWVQDHIVEIVKNIREAPFLQYIFDSKGIRTQRRRVPPSALEHTPSECWNYVRESVTTASPDGLILVRKLDEQTSRLVRDARSLSAAGQCPMQDSLCLRRSLDLTRTCGRDKAAGNTQSTKDGGDGDGDGSSVDVWGVLVQGKGDAGSSCYILETTRAVVPGGTSCTRFCLTRAQCFGPSLQAQMVLMWLQK